MSANKTDRYKKAKQTTIRSLSTPQLRYYTTNLGYVNFSIGGNGFTAFEVQEENCIVITYNNHTHPIIYD
ncbi:MAG: hypothetical protein LBE09_00315 [Christensenellaceae bacterium]|nr:hypothetical protein [Christensenellaceae bacterium]